MLLLLHYGGSLLMATCLGSIFAPLTANRDLDGVQARFGLFFFVLLYLSLLSMSSLPVWRDEQALFAHERAGGLYSDLAYFAAVVACDLVLVRALPPLAFALVTYRAAGLKAVCESCLADFAAGLVLMNVTASLVASAVDAPSTAVANVAGALVALFFGAFGGFRSRATRSRPRCAGCSTSTRSPTRSRRCSSTSSRATTGNGKPVFWGINGSICAPDLPCVRRLARAPPPSPSRLPPRHAQLLWCEGETILATFSLRPSTRRSSPTCAPCTRSRPRGPSRRTPCSRSRRRRPPRAGGPRRARAVSARRHSRAARPPTSRARRWTPSAWEDADGADDDPDDDDSVNDDDDSDAASSECATAARRRTTARPTAATSSSRATRPRTATRAPRRLARLAVVARDALGARRLPPRAKPCCAPCRASRAPPTASAAASCAR